MSVDRVLGALLIVGLSGCDCGGTKLVDAPELPDAGEPIAAPTCAERTELCNGQDDDCDGEVDEGLPRVSCGVGACARELPGCFQGQPVTCTPAAGSAEQCNAVDDDCDGEVDEGLLPQTCGVGECAELRATCTQGQVQVCSPRQGTDEVCNGKDDDCDGTVDEGLLANTSGDLRITNDAAGSDFVYLGAGNGGFGLAWQDKRDGAAMKGEIYFAALQPDGRRRGSDLRVSTSAGTSSHPAVVWNGTGWGLVYADDVGGDTALYFRPLSAQGQPQGAATRIVSSAGDADWPDMVWTGQGYALAWDDSRLGASKHDIFVRRLDSQGRPVGSEVRVTTDAARQSNPILKWNGSGFGLVWNDSRHGSGREVYFRRLDGNLQPVGAEVRLTQDAADSAWPDLAWNGVDREWAVVWHDLKTGNSEIFFARVSEQGARLGTEVRLSDAVGTSQFPSIDWNGFQYGVSWQDDRVAGGRPAVYFAHVSARGQKTAAELKLSNGSGSASFTTALWNGSTFAFAWRDDRDAPTGNTELYFATVGCPTP